MDYKQRRKVKFRTNIYFHTDDTSPISFSGLLDELIYEYITLLIEKTGV